MKHRDDATYLHDMQEAISQVGQYLKGVPLGSFYLARMRQDAVVRQIEIVGEAAGKLSAALRERWPQANWSEVSGMRNRLAHAYFDIDLDVV